MSTVIGYYASVGYTLLQVIAMIGHKRLDNDLLLRVTIASGFALVTAVIAFK